MRAIYLSLFAAFLAIGDTNHAHASKGTKWLVIELPDGARGGRGRIQGMGSLSPEKNSPLDYLQIAQRCGARFPMFSVNFSHRAHIISWSTPNDRIVVKCLKAKLPRHFNAGVARPDAAQGFTRPDPAPFRDLESVAGQSPKKAY